MPCLILGGGDRGFSGVCRPTGTDRPVVGAERDGRAVCRGADRGVGAEP